MRITFNQKHDIAERLRDGFGVEDIALAMKMDVESIRFWVRQLRARGTLKHICNDARVGVKEGKDE